MVIAMAMLFLARWLTSSSSPLLLPEKLIPLAQARHQDFFEPMPVAQLGLEFLGAIRDPLLQDLVQTLGAPLSPGPAGDVQEGREVLDHQPVRVAHRADELRGPDLAAVFGVEHYFLIERLLGPHGGPDAAFHLGIGVRPSEEEVVLAEHLLAGGAAEIDEGLVHVK